MRSGEDGLAWPGEAGTVWSGRLGRVRCGLVWCGRRGGGGWVGEVCCGEARQARMGEARLVLVRRGLDGEAGKVRRGWFRSGMSWLGELWQARTAWHGGEGRQGPAECGEVWTGVGGKVGHGRYGRVRRVADWQGRARQARVARSVWQV